MWPFKDYSKIRTVQEFSVSPNFVGKVKHLSNFGIETGTPKNCSKRTRRRLKPLSDECMPLGARFADGLGLSLSTGTVTVSTQSNSGPYLDGHLSEGKVAIYALQEMDPAT